MVDPEAVKRELARLASDEADEPAAPAIAEAEAAVADVREAAAWVADGGEERLRDAVGVAESAGESELAARGRAVLATLERFRDAASGDHAGNGRPAGRAEPVGCDGELADHFHPGHVTPKGGSGEGADE